MSSPKYAEIVQQLREEIATMRPGSRFASENQIGLRFGVSRPTAARALQELRTAGLVERRVGTGTFVAGAGTRPMANGTTIGLMLAGLGSTEVWDPITRHIMRAASALNLPIVVGPDESPRDEVSAVNAQADWMLEREVSGVLFAPLENVANRERENRAVCERFTSLGIPIVLLDRDLVEFPGRSDFDVVGMDDFRAGAAVGEHLINRGLGRAMFLSRPGHPGTTDLRSAGCRWALSRGGVTVPNDWHVSGDPTDDSWVETTLKQHSPRVVVCANDRTAALLIQTLTRLGHDVPGDLAVVGFDDVVYSRLLQVSLTTVAQPFARIGEVALNRLLARIEDPSLPAVELLLGAELVVRDSTSV
ncbi:MAG: GntR family transcriptional regulator [Propionicimonas sp.]